MFALEFKASVFIEELFYDVTVFTVLYAADAVANFAFWFYHRGCSSQKSALGFCDLSNYFRFYSVASFGSFCQDPSIRARDVKQNTIERAFFASDGFYVFVVNYGYAV